MPVHACLARLAIALEVLVVATVVVPVRLLLMTHAYWPPVEPP